MKRLLMTLLLIGATAGEAADDTAFAVTWDGVQDARVAYYDLAWGATTGARTAHSKITAGTTTGRIQVSGLPTYFVAVRACASDTFCSEWSNEVSVPMISTPTNVQVTFTWQTTQ